MFTYSLYCGILCKKTLVIQILVFRSKAKCTLDTFVLTTYYAFLFIPYLQCFRFLFN